MGWTKTHFSMLSNPEHFRHFSYYYIYVYLHIGQDYAVQSDISFFAAQLKQYDELNFFFLSNQNIDRVIV